ncbi:MAG TPA: hypothetical protein DCZ11_02885, partial [Gammaproteobacteria bacterium]|nr:hypothetical protein [Gammaproteobacteria bacterium]MCH77370.1 hypothetical protein [Gammaproteobacteria bacterium]
MAVLALRCAETAAFALAGVLAWWLHPGLGPITPFSAATVVVVTLAAAWMCERFGAALSSRGCSIALLRR